MPPLMPMRVDAQLVPYSPPPSLKPCWPTKKHFLGTRTNSSVCSFIAMKLPYCFHLDDLNYSLQHPQEDWYLVTHTEEDSNFNDDSLMHSRLYSP